MKFRIFKNDLILIALAAMLAFRKFKNGLIKALFYEAHQMMKASNFIEEWIQGDWEKGWLEGWKEGWSEGWKEGWREAWRDGRISTLLKWAKKILGRVRSDLKIKISALYDDEIEKLAQDLLDMKVQSDLEQWFQIHEKNNKEN